MTYDYIVIGSGAGGGTVAARLAEAGMRVLVVEAGGDPVASGGARMPEDYDVPAFNAFASENSATAWSFGVNHYSDPVRAQRDGKLMANGHILYPRAAALGGCTVHNALILMKPGDGDWDAIADLTGDASWRADHMQRYWQRIENCRHRPVWRWLSRLGINPTGHGWAGWLDTQIAMPTAALTDRALLATMIISAAAAFDALTQWSPGRLLRGLWQLIIGKGDPNDARMQGREGIWYEPISARHHKRRGARERLLDVAARHPDRLTIALDTLATALVFDGAGRVIGVDVRHGARLYGAHPDASLDAGEPQRLLASREVILAGGAFNTPQLLLLSGIGPRAELEALGITCRVDLPGVGRNLQDRYEVGVVHQMTRPWAALGGAHFRRDDPLFAQWQANGQGMYGSNGVAIALTRRSQPSKPVPDLFLMALLARFEGYAPGYSNWLTDHHDCLTWAVLLAHTANRAGRVTLASTDPRAPPRIDFNYFDTGDDSAGADLAAVVRGVELARAVARPLRGDRIARELVPGDDVQGPALTEWVRDHAWGHHASCSAAIGPRDVGGVLDSRLRVHGVPGLRVVDASVFPRIPGFFIVSAVYMVGEKAAEMILADGGS